MNRITKKVRGQLFDNNSKTILSESLVTITQIDTQYPDDRPRYEVSLTVDGYKPELDNKTYLLKIGNNLIGEIFISISSRELPGRQTHFKVNLQDSIWNNLDWFKNI
jgi:hypothetical protein